MSEETTAEARGTAWPFVELEAAAEDAESLGAALLDAGSTGLEERGGEGGRVRLVAYFPAPPDLGELARAVAAAPGVEPGAARAAAATLRAGETPDDDWLRAWKRGFEPVPVGERLLVYPSWKRDLAEQFRDRVRLEIDPGMAFGTGTHETTRLCLEWLDEWWQGGSLLDVGTGTGILAIAAALLAPEARVVGVDVDPLAVGIARENAEANGVAERISFDTSGADTAAGEFDVVVANLTADVIVLALRHLTARLRPAGRLVLSGVLVEQAEGLVSELADAGLEVAWRRDAGEWTALEVRRR